jgi:hypothetical protein
MHRWEMRAGAGGWSTAPGVQAQNPLDPFTDAAQGERALVKGYYRFIDQPDEAALTVENILLPHREQTLRRMQAEATVLCIQDGTDLNFDGMAEGDGLGIIGSNQTEAKTRGLHLHSTLAVNEEGVPLGVLRMQFDAPTSRPKQDRRPAYEIPIEEKQTYAWLLGLRDLRNAAASTPRTRLVSVMDRGADIFELFDEWRKDPSVDLLVRAQQNRGTTGHKNLFDAVRSSEPRLELELSIGRQSARPKRSTQEARPGRKARTATVTLRYQKIELAPSFFLRPRAPRPRRYCSQAQGPTSADDHQGRRLDRRLPGRLSAPQERRAARAPTRVAGLCQTPGVLHRLLAA